MTLAVVAFLLLVLALGLLFILSRRPKEPAPSIPPGADLTSAVRELLGAGRKLEAVKLVRDRTGQDLKNSLAAVEGIGQGANPTLDRPASPSIDADIATLIDAGNSIEAIKRVREATGLGLKEAKELVDRYRAR